MTPEQDQILKTFDETLAWAFRNEDSISTVTQLLVRALATSPIQRHHITEAYEALGI